MANTHIGSKPARSPSRLFRVNSSIDRRILFLVPALTLSLFVMIYPVGKLLLQSFTLPRLGLQNYWNLIVETLYVRVILSTLEISLLVTLMCAVLGFPFARVIANASPTARRWLIFTILVPLWTSTLVRTFAWLVLLQRDGLINQFLIWFGVTDQPLQLVHNRLGVMIGMTQVLLPFMVLPLFSVMTRIDSGFERAAASLGANPIRVFYRVYLPMALPGLMNGCVLVFVLCLGYYITPAMLGGPGDVMIAQLIQLQIGTFGDWGGAAALCVALLATVGVTLGLFKKAFGRNTVLR